MSKILKIKPKEGLMVPYPKSDKMLHKDGADVTATAYWRRRLMDGDVVLIKPETKKTKPKTTNSGDK